MVGSHRRAQRIPRPKGTNKQYQCSGGRAGADLREIKMIGYHYTSWQNWLKIKKKGLQPYLIDKPEIKCYYPNGLYGIWIWKNRLLDKEHIGSILWQIYTKCSFEIVELKVVYSINDLYKDEKYCFDAITHTGDIRGWKYHENVPVIILGKPVLPSNIKLVKKYDFYALLRRDDETM